MSNLRRFNPTSKRPDRAVQAWQILVSAAMDRRTITYLQLSHLMYGKSASGVLAEVLGYIAFFCIEENLPILTSIVVNQETGLPGSHIPMDLNTLNSEREKVYKTDWYDIYPPTADQLVETYSNINPHKKSSVDGN